MNAVVKFHFFATNIFLLASLLIVVSSCFSSTKYTGQYRLMSSLDDNKKIAYLDYTELSERDMQENYEASFDYYSAAYADFDLMTCSMEDPDKIGPICIRRCKEVFEADLVIVSTRVSCREGLSRQKIGPPDEATMYVQNNTQDIGIIHFSIYDTHIAEELISFNVRTKSTGIGIKNKDESTTTVNPSTCNYVLGKARRKGIKKILKQLN